MAKADLHVHTTASDGHTSPEEVVREAQKRGLDVLSITDHDTIDGYLKARNLASESDIQLISGIELTTSFNGRECHLLAYGFEPENEDFKKLLKSHKIKRVARAQKIIKILTAQGLELEIQEVLGEATGDTIGRPHIARLLVEKGYVRNFREAFIRFLSDHHLEEMPQIYPELPELIPIIKNAGGAVVLAHPGDHYSDSELEELIGMGLDGLECWHPSHNYSKEIRLTNFAERYHLLRTGGSDYHGIGFKQDQRFGVVAMSMSKVEDLFRLLENRKKLIADSAV